MSYLQPVINLPRAIKAVQNFRSGAQRRADQERDGSGERVLFEGKVCAYNDIISWLKDKQREAEKWEADPVVWG